MTFNYRCKSVVFLCILKLYNTNIYSFSLQLQNSMELYLSWIYKIHDQEKNHRQKTSKHQSLIWLLKYWSSLQIQIYQQCKRQYQCTSAIPVLPKSILFLYECSDQYIIHRICFRFIISSANLLTCLSSFIVDYAKIIFIPSRAVIFSDSHSVFKHLRCMWINFKRSFQPFYIVSERQ